MMHLTASCPALSVAVGSAITHRAPRRPVLLLTLALAGLARVAAAAPHLVADLNTGPAGDDLYELLIGIEHGGVSYFPATDPQEGGELWRTDGTAAGTYRLTDLCPGSCSSGATPVAFLGDALLFVAGDGDRQAELWRTDGIPGHETLVKELCPGLCNVQVDDTIVWNGALWLLVQRAGQAPTLWRSDGTPGGTRQVQDLCADDRLCGFGPYTHVGFVGATAADDALLLSVFTNGAIWLVRSDGTAAGTVRLYRFAAYAQVASSRTQDATLAGSAVAGQEAVAAPVYFLDGSQLWVSDGTPAGTHLVRDVSDLLSEIYLQNWAVIDGVFYAVGDYGEWLRSDGTAAGTFLLATVDSEFRPAICSIGSAVFAVTTTGIWTTGGTPATTTFAIALPLDFIEEVIEQPGRLYIQAYPFLWVTDGTAAGTHRIGLPGVPMPDEYTLVPLLVGAAFTTSGNVLWRIDAATLEVTQLHNFEPADGSSGPYGQIGFGDQLLFCGQDTSGDDLIFASDGTAAGTHVLDPALHFAPCWWAGQANLFGVAGDHAFVTAGGRFWATDGTERGTRPLGSSADLATGVPFAVLGGRLLFAGTPSYDPQCGPVDTQPWITDGTSEHTQQIVALNPFAGPLGGSMCDDLPLSSDPGPGVSLDRTVLFAADDLVHGRELFVTDGTAAGTRLVADLNPGLMPNTVTEDGKPPLIGVGSNPTDFVRFRGGAFFVADDGTTGRQVYFSNGEPEGTYRVLGNDRIVHDSAPHDLVVFAGALYFIAAHGSGEALFRSDATSAGTVLVDDLVLDGQPSFARALTVVERQLFFVVFNETTGSELWVSQGAAASTHLVLDLRPGFLGSAPQNLAAVGKVLVFAADDGLSGLEPWRSDGTPAGTFRLGDIAVGEASSSPGPFTVVGEQVLFGADDGVHGRELWAIPLADVVRERP